MIDEEKVRFAVMEFLKNPAWKAEYYDAPTHLSRRHVELGFYQSVFAEELDENEIMWEDYKKEMNEIEEKIGLEAWVYLLRHCGNNPFRTVCKNKVKELKGDES